MTSTGCSACGSSTSAFAKQTDGERRAHELRVDYQNVSNWQFAY